MLHVCCVDIGDILDEIETNQKLQFVLVSWFHQLTKDHIFLLFIPQVLSEYHLRLNSTYSISAFSHDPNSPSCIYNPLTHTYAPELSCDSQSSIRITHPHSHIFDAFGDKKLTGEEVKTSPQIPVSPQFKTSVRHCHFHQGLR